MIEFMKPHYTNWMDLEEAAKEMGGEAWYCERNGDPIGIVAHNGTSKEDLPKRFRSYVFLPWEKIADWPPEERYTLSDDGVKRYV